MHQGYCRSCEGSSVFHFTTLNFWNSLNRLCSCPYSDAHFRNDLTYVEPLCPELCHSIAIEDPLKTVWRADSFQKRLLTVLIDPKSVPDQIRLQLPARLSTKRILDFDCPYRRLSFQPSTVSSFLALASSSWR